MPSIRDVFTLYTQLSPLEQKKLYSMISYQLPTDNNFEEFVKDERFTSGFACPHCGCIGHISRNGHIYEYSRAVKPQFRRNGNRVSGTWEPPIMSLLA